MAILAAGTGFTASRLLFHALTGGAECKEQVAHGCSCAEDLMSRQHLPCRAALALKGSSRSRLLNLRSWDQLAQPCISLAAALWAWARMSSEADVVIQVQYSAATLHSCRPVSVHADRLDGLDLSKRLALPLPI